MHGETRPQMPQARYSVSFTTGALYLRESISVTELYLQTHNWKDTRDQVISENLLQARTRNTLNRVCREIVSRLRTLSDSELSFLPIATFQDQRYLLWVAFCRRYRLVADFAVEVLHERYLSLQIDLNPTDFDAFFNRKAEWHPELDQVRAATRNKLRQVVFKVLRDAELLTAENQIIQAHPSAPLAELLSRANRRDLLLFPSPEIGAVGAGS